MRIAYLATSILPSRTANSVHVMKMCAALAGLGHEVALLAPDRAAEAETGVEDLFAHYGVTPDFDIWFLPYVHPQGSRVRNLLSTTRTWLGTRRYLKRLNPDLALGRDLAGLHAAACLGLPTICEYHAPVGAWRLEVMLFERLKRHPAVLRHVVISKALARIYTERLGLDPAKVLVAHDAADPVTDHSIPADWPGRADALQAGYVGALYPGRGVRLLLDLARRNPGADFHFVGGDLADLARWRGADTPGNVFFHGHRDWPEAQRCRNACHVLLAPYKPGLSVAGGGGDTSAFMSPLKIFEYMASGKAILCSDMPVLREVLDKSTARLVPPGDIESWDRAFKELAADQSLRAGLGDAARRRFLARHTWKARARHILDGPGVAA